MWRRRSWLLLALLALPGLCFWRAGWSQAFVNVPPREHRQRVGFRATSDVAEENDLIAQVGDELEGCTPLKKEHAPRNSQTVIAVARQGECKLSPADAAVWSEVAQKQDQEDQKLKQNDVLLDVIEADLNAMEAQMEKAEVRYQQARQRLTRKLEEGKDKPAEGKHSPHIQPSEDHPIDEAEALPPEDHKHQHHKHLQREPKNAGALPDKVVSRQRWVAARNTEKRARESAKRARELMRNRQRDRKMEAGYVSQEVEAAAPKESAPAPRPPAASASPEAVLHGAQNLAARLKSVHDRETSAVDKRQALLKVVTCGRENYYTFKPEDVVSDLNQRGLIDEKLATEFAGLIKDETLKPTVHQIPFEEWLDRAKKDVPFKADEAAYLGHLDGRQLAVAEAELEAAEAQLEIAMKAAADASTRYEQAVAASGIDHATLEQTEQADFDLSVNEAERFDAEHSHDKFESHGSKNAGALPDKVVSRDRWLAARSTEERAREAQKKARDVGRSHARDAKGWSFNFKKRLEVVLNAGRNFLRDSEDGQGIDKFKDLLEWLQAQRARRSASAPFPQSLGPLSVAALHKGDKEIVLVGTPHSVPGVAAAENPVPRAVRRLVKALKPDLVAVELDEDRGGRELENLPAKLQGRSTVLLPPTLSGSPGLLEAFGLFGGPQLRLDDALMEQIRARLGKSQMSVKDYIRAMKTIFDKSSEKCLAMNVFALDELRAEAYGDWGRDAGAAVQAAFKAAAPVLLCDLPQEWTFSKIIPVYNDAWVRAKEKRLDFLSDLSEAMRFQEAEEAIIREAVLAGHGGDLSSLDYGLGLCRPATGLAEADTRRLFLEERDSAMARAVCEALDGRAQRVLGEPREEILKGQAHAALRAVLQVGCCHVEGIVAEMEKQGYEVADSPSAGWPSAKAKKPKASDRQVGTSTKKVVTKRTKQRGPRGFS
eukprot:s4461_g5.t3